MEAKAGGLSAQRTVLMMLLFWSLQPSPNTYPRLGGGCREREEERSGASVQAGEKQCPLQ